ncbi:MAG: alpha/beta hydrolase [Alteraurantiacibacter sp.]
MKLFLSSALLVAALFIAACSFNPLRTFNALVPKDGGSERIAEGIAYGGNDRQKLDIYAPTDGDVTGRPTIVWFYGGSWNSGSRKGYGFVGRALASRGFVTVIADYRLVPDVRFPGFLEDGAGAVRWTRENIDQYGGDGERIVLGGHSAGAYIAAMLANDPRWLGEGRDAVKGMVGLAGPYDFAPFDVDSTIAAFGEWPDPADTQPVTFADAGAPPHLLLTGENDDTVEPRNSEALAAKLREAGVEAGVRRYPGVEHINIVVALSRVRRGRAPVLDDVTDFVRRVTSE